jgi:hypothetical protein
MATKRFCDFCKKEIEMFADFCLIAISAANRNPSIEYAFSHEVCRPCKTKTEEFIKGMSK